MGYDKKLVLENIQEDESFKIWLDQYSFLKPLLVSDITPEYINGLNNKDVNRFLTGPRKEKQTLSTVKEFILSNKSDSQSIFFGLFVANDLVGTCRLHDITTEQAYLGLAIFNKEMWGKGYARKIISALCDFASESLELHCIKAGVHKENIASKKAFESVGFSVSSDLGDAEELKIKLMS